MPGAEASCVRVGESFNAVGDVICCCSSFFILASLLSMTLYQVFLGLVSCYVPAQIGTDT